jgi:hypothetical protein
MPGFSPFLPAATTPDWQGLPQRYDAAVTTLAEVCGLDAPRERGRFATCIARLGQSPPPSEEASLVNRLTQLVGESLPLMMELVLTLAGQGPRGFAYLTQGRPGASFPTTLGTLLAGTLQLHLESGGDAAEAELLADLFHLSFPELNALADRSPLSQGMVVGVVPAGAGLQLKVYFNTRLDGSVDHRARVRAMLARCRLSDNGLYDTLYANVEGAWFQGVGVDLDNDRHHRAKLYVRLQRPVVPSALAALAAHVGATAGVVEPVLALIDALDSPAMADELELAAALCDDAPLTAKLTVFFGSETVTAADAERLLGYLKGLGYPTAGVAAVIDSLCSRDPRLRDRRPLHGVGIEVPVGARPKINLYLQPVL